MIKIIKFFLYTLLIVVVIAFCLDWLYTYSYKNPVYARDKVSWMYSINEKKIREYDYALFGSSRCIYHINPVQIEKETGIKGINLGYSGSNPFEIKLMVHEFLQIHQPDQIFVQLDNRFNRVHRDPISITPWIPFIHKPYLYEEIKKNDSLGFYLKNIPFYRYTQYESKLGIRNVALSYMKENNFAELEGFKAMSGIAGKGKIKDYNLIDEPNPHILEIQKWCDELGVKVYFFTAPYYNRTLNTAVIAKHVAPYKDFSEIFDDRLYFSDPNHLNRKGAEAFTHIFIKQYFKIE